MNRIRCGVVVAVGVAAALVGCDSGEPPRSNSSQSVPSSIGSTPRTVGSSVPQIPGAPYTIVRTLPHDPEAFTEGLVIVDGVLYESTGSLGSGSSVRIVDLGNGTVTKQVSQPKEFGEGLTEIDGLLYQLTWRNRKAHVFNRADLTPVRDHAYPEEGWGLTDDGRQLIASDGSARLYFRDPSTFAITKTVTVTDAGKPVDQLNELELVGDEIFANIFGTTRIARIDISTGAVRSWLDFAELSAPYISKEENAVLNGIALDPGTGHLYITGKLWPTMFEISLPS